MLEKGEKYLDNQICGFNGCIKPATVRVTFQVGFSARFCDECSDIMIKEGLGKR
jgi:hypothetical protein